MPHHPAGQFGYPRYREHVGRAQCIDDQVLGLPAVRVIGKRQTRNRGDGRLVAGTLGADQ
jgi:hypothetical protein